VYNSPAQHPRISTEERKYIEQALNKKTEKKVVAWHTFMLIHYSMLHY